MWALNRRVSPLRAPEIRVTPRRTITANSLISWQSPLISAKEKQWWHKPNGCWQTASKYSARKRRLCRRASARTYRAGFRVHRQIQWITHPVPQSTTHAGNRAAISSALKRRRAPGTSDQSVRLCARRNPEARREAFFHFRIQAHTAMTQAGRGVWWAGPSDSNTWPLTYQKRTTADWSFFRFQRMTWLFCWQSKHKHAHAHAQQIWYVKRVLTLRRSFVFV